MEKSQNLLIVYKNLIDHIIQVCNFSLRKITILWLLSFQNFYKFWIFLCDFLTPVTSGQSSIKIQKLSFLQMFMISYAFYVLSPTDKTVDDFFEGIFQKH